MNAQMNEWNYELAQDVNANFHLLEDFKAVA